MSGDQQPSAPDAKWRNALSTALAVLGAVLIPNLLTRIVHLPISWGNVVGLSVAATLAYLLLPEPKKNAGRFTLIILGSCVLAWFVGHVLEK